jgi:hypothetical protein
MPETRQTGAMWEVDLNEPGRRLTAIELLAMESQHNCQQLRRLIEAMEEAALRLGSLEGRFDRLEQFLLTVAPHQYPRSTEPTRHALSDEVKEAS